MTFTPGAQRATIAVFFCALALVYVFAWSLPAIGLDHDDAGFLITAKAIAAGHGYIIENLPKPIPQTNFPPLFPAVLSLLTLLSQQTQWLKLLPLACAAAWLVVTRNLLLKMGASRNGALLLVGLTAASPTVVFLSTNLLPETLFALLAAAALLTLLEERALLSGIIAGLATLTRTSGAALIVACILTLVARRRFRGAAVFAAAAMIIVAPWFGWSLAHLAPNGSSNYVASDIFTGLAANEKLVVLAHNLLSLLAGPFLLLTGFGNFYSIFGTIAILLWCLYFRRQLVPDLFVALYCLVLLCWVSPPQRSVAPILPLFLWIVWRVVRLMHNREALAALVLIACALPFWADASRLLPARANGAFAVEGAPPDKWSAMQAAFRFIRANTAPDSVLLANMDGAFFLNTARRTVRGFAPNNFDLYYAARPSAVTPDQLSKAILQSHVAWVVLTPDRDLAESPSFHRSVEALERGGVVEPVSIPGLQRDYSLFKVTLH